MDSWVYRLARAGAKLRAQARGMPRTASLSSRLKPGRRTVRNSVSQSLHASRHSEFVSLSAPREAQAEDSKPRETPCQRQASSQPWSTPRRGFKAFADASIDINSQYDQPTSSFIVATSDLTASTLFRKSACSCSVRSSSTIRSTPPAPKMTGTPT